MQASTYFAHMQNRDLGSIAATHRATKEDKRQATGSNRIDWHADRKTEQE